MTTETTIEAKNTQASIMANLRQGTAAAHKQLEKSSCFKRLFANDYQLDEYASLLSYFYGFFAAIEPTLFKDLPTSYRDCVKHRQKTQLLRKDLAFFDKNTDDLAICDNLPPMNNFAEKMGVLYVLEGSMLGGRMIGRHLSKHFQTDIQPALNFYHCYGENLDKEWQAFSAMMNRCFADAESTEHSEILAAANATFMGLQAWVERCMRAEQMAEAA
jgi:heme oxygenase